MIIETERLILRPFTKGDAADAFEYLHEPTVNCFKDMALATIEDAEKEMEKRLTQTDYYFAIVLKDENKVIGEVFAYPEDHDHEEKSDSDTFSPCWMLNQKYQRKGYAFEAVHAVFDYLFCEKGARRLYAYTEDYNVSSQRLCEKLGMRKEGEFKEFISFVNDSEGNPIYEDTYQYAILKKEWQAKNK